MGENEKKQTNYQTEKFEGVVIVKDFMLAQFPGETDTFLGFSGKVSILRDQDIVGFKTEGNANANWIARVEGETHSINILGCQIKAVIEGPNSEDDGGRRVCRVP